MYYIKPCDGYITSFMSRGRRHPVAGVIRPHQGIDIGSSANNNVWAAAGGTVISVSYNKTAGNYVLISHPNGQITSYSHLSKIIVKNGVKVKQGQNIGVKGATGSATGVHLHFEINSGPWTNTYASKLNPLLFFVDPLTKEIQQLLSKLGYKLDVDGIYGEGTITAVAQYQKSKGLTVDGYAGRGTHAALKADVSKKPVNKPSTDKPQKEESVRMFNPTTGTLRSEYEAFLQQAKKDGILKSDDHLKKYKAGKLPLDDAIALMATVNNRKK